MRRTIVATISMLALTTSALMFLGPTPVHAEDTSNPPAATTAANPASANSSASPANTPTSMNIASPAAHTFSLGFHSGEEPIGFRWWAKPRVGVDAGFGFRANQTSLVNGGEQYLLSFSGEAGIPIVLKRWSRVNFIVRPGLAVQSADAEFEDPETFETTVEKTLTITARAELETEVFLADNVSASASHGFEVSAFKFDVPGQTFQKTLSTTSGDLFTVGLHVYLWGHQK